jgi:hypothetical protein
MVALGSFGCSNDSPSSPSPVLAVMLKDTPFSDAQAVLVTFSEVSVHASGGSFVPVPFSGGAATRTCDLKKLTSAQDVLGTGPLAAGHYTQVRLTVSSATIYFNNPSSGAACAASIPTPAGTSAPVNIPSGQIILNREFDLSNSTTTTILLDFNGDQSINQLGNGTYQMSPVISIVSVG